MSDHRTLITQLCDELDHNRRCLLDDRRVTHPLADRARAVLAHQPDFRALCAELLLFSEQAGEICTCEGLWPKCDPNYTLLNRARAVLAADGPAVPEGREPAAIVGEPSNRTRRVCIWSPTQMAECGGPCWEAQDPSACDCGALWMAVPEGREPASVVEQPSDKELNALWNCSGIADEHGNHTGNIFEFARAVLSRWGHQPAPLPAEGEVGELVEFLRIYGDEVMDEYGDVGEHDQLTRAADLLEQRHPTPVPVASDIYFEFVISDADYCTQAGGIAPTYAQALSEGQHYLAQYQQDGPHTLELRRVEVLNPDALPLPAEEVE